MIIYTDGSTINNGKSNATGGFGLYIPKLSCEVSYKLISTKNIKITNQLSELLAIMYSLEYLQDKTIDDDIIYIYTDSQYSINCITKWCKNWKKNNWKNSKNKTIENYLLITRIYNFINNFPKNIIFVHIRSHQNEPEKNSESYQHWFGNNKADELASRGSIVFDVEDYYKKLESKKIDLKID